MREGEVSTDEDDDDENVPEVKRDSPRDEHDIMFHNQELVCF